MKKNVNVVSIVIIIFFVLLGAYIIISNRIGDAFEPNYTLEDFYTIPRKEVGVNEYTPVLTTEEDMVKTYFNTYVSLLFESLSTAYSLLDSSELEKFPNLETFKKYASDLTDDFKELPRIKDYKIETIDGKKIITIGDANFNRYIFTIEAVMKYTVKFE